METWLVSVLMGFVGVTAFCADPFDREKDPEGIYPYFLSQPGDSGSENCADAVVASPLLTIEGTSVFDRRGVHFLYALKHGNLLGVGSTATDFVSLVSLLSNGDSRVEWRNPSGELISHKLFRDAEVFPKFTVEPRVITAKDGSFTIFQGHTRHPILATTANGSGELTYLTPGATTALESHEELYWASRWDSAAQTPVKERVEDDEIHTIATLLFEEVGPIKHILTVTNFGDLTLWDNSSGRYEPKRLRTGIMRPYKTSVPNEGEFLGGNGEVEFSSVDRRNDAVSAALSPDGSKLVVGFSPGVLTQFSIEATTYFPREFPDSRGNGNSVFAETRSLNASYLPTTLSFLDDKSNSFVVAGHEPTHGRRLGTPGFEHASKRFAYSHSAAMIYRKEEGENFTLTEVLDDHPGASIAHLMHSESRMVTITADPDSKIRIFGMEGTRRTLKATIRVFDTEQSVSGMDGVNGPLSSITSAILSPTKTHVYVGTDSGLLLSIRLDDGAVVGAKRVNIVSKNENIVSLTLSRDSSKLFVATVFAMYRIDTNDL